MQKWFFVWYNITMTRIFQNNPNSFRSKKVQLSFNPENILHKSDSFTASSSTTYASTKALVDGLATKQSALLIATATASNSAVIDFTLPSGYDYFELFINYLVPQTDATSFFMRASIDGGSTFLAGASDYTVQRNNLTGSGGTTYVPSYGTAAQISSIGNLVGNASTDFFRGSFRIFNPSTSGSNKYVTGEVSMMRSDNQPALISLSAIINNTSAVNAIRLLMSSGNITSGQFSLYGYK